MKFTILGKPQALARPRVTKTHTYNPQQQKTEEVFYDLQRQYRVLSGALKVPYKKALQVIMTFYMPIPKSWSKIKQNEAIGRPVQTRPDIDNMIKFYLDAGQNALWLDDSFVTHIIAKKLYDHTPRTEIQIVEFVT